MNTDPHDNVVVGAIFPMPQKYHDWYTSRCHWNYQVLAPVGTPCTVQGFHDWPGEETVVRVELPDKRVYIIPLRIVAEALRDNDHSTTVVQR